MPILLRRGAQGLNFMDYVTCQTCGAIVKPYEIRGICCVCGKRTCIACVMRCDQCKRVACQSCISSSEAWRDSTHYFRSLCKHCKHNRWVIKINHVVCLTAEESRQKREFAFVPCAFNRASKTKEG